MSAGRPPRRAKRLDYVHFADWLKRNLSRRFTQRPKTCVLAAYANEHCSCSAKTHVYGSGREIVGLGTGRRRWWTCYRLTYPQAKLAEAALDFLPDEYDGTDVAFALRLVAFVVSFMGLVVAIVLSVVVYACLLVGGRVAGYPR